MHILPAFRKHPPLSCLLLLVGMKRRFVFISRFSIAGGLVSAAVDMQFPSRASVYVRRFAYIYINNYAYIYIYIYMSGSAMHKCVCRSTPVRSLYHPKQSSLSVCACAAIREEERVRGDDKWLGHTSRN